MLRPINFSQVRSSQLLKFLILLGLTASYTLNAQVKIGENAENVSDYAVLELESSDKGLLIVRMDTEARDQAFSQDTPVGMVIYNTDLDMLQFYQYEVNATTGRRSGKKVWGTSLTRSVHSAPPSQPESGDLYFDAEANQLYVWNPIQKEWISIGGSANATAVTPDEILKGSVDPKQSDLQSAAGYYPIGTLFLNSTTGYLYMTEDNDNDGQVDSWMRVTGRGIDNLGNHILNKDLNLKTFTLIDTDGVGGTPGQLLTRTASGTLWADATPSFTTTNGLNLNNKVLKLGGALTEPTVIQTDATNTIAITGLESTTYDPNINLVSVDQTSGVLQRVNVTNIVQEEVIKHIAVENQIQFQTPLVINSTSKINVYRNGVLIDFTQSAVNMIQVEAPAKCYQGDEIKIIQFQ